MRLLLVEDNRADARLFAELLSEIPRQPFSLTTVETLAAATPVVGDYDLVFLDLSLPDAQGIETLTAMIAAARNVPIVVLTGNDDERTAMETVKAGAQDYLRKADITPALIARTAGYAVERKKAEENTHRLARSDDAARRARFISGVVAAIMASLDLDVTLREVARLLVPTLGDFVAIDIARSEGTMDRIAHAVHDPSREGLVEAICAVAPGPANPNSLVFRAVKARASILMSQIDLQAALDSELYTTMVVTYGVSSLLITPLIARGRVVGAISYGMTQSRRVHDHELQRLAEEVAERIALGIDNAELYRAAQKAVSARDELLAVVSHDLRNPLGIVALALQLIERDPASLASGLPRAKRAVDRMQRLIADLLDVAQIESGTLGVDLKPIDIGVVLDDAFEQHRALAADKGIQLVREPARVGAAVVDRDRLGQALANLIGNALKFTPPGGTVRLGAEVHGDRVTLSVTDSGPGISREHLHHIFDRFWQRERRSDGIGLGLAIVKGIVDAHGGSVEVESSIGEGATFRIGVLRPAQNATLH